MLPRIHVTKVMLHLKHIPRTRIQKSANEWCLILELMKTYSTSSSYTLVIYHVLIMYLEAINVILKVFIKLRTTHFDLSLV